MHGPPRERVAEQIQACIVCTNRHRGLYKNLSKNTLFFTKQHDLDRKRIMGRAPAISAEQALFERFSPVIAVSLAYITLMGVFQYLQSFSKWSLYLKQSRRPKEERMSLKQAHYGEEGRLDNIRLMADRSVGNTLEWSWMFMTPLWLHAFFISVPNAAFWGWTYVVVRAFYPLFFLKGFVWGVTVLNYLSLYMLTSPLALRVVFGWS